MVVVVVAVVVVAVVTTPEDVAKARHDEEAEEADDAQEVSEMIKEEEKAARIRRKRIIDESKFTPSVVRVAKVDTMNSKWHLKLESVKGIVGFNVPEQTTRSSRRQPRIYDGSPRVRSSAHILKARFLATGN